MSTNSSHRGRKRKGSKNKRQVPEIDRQIIHSGRTMGAADTNFPSEDLLRSAPSMTLSQTPPKNIRGQIHWIQYQSQRTQTLSASATTEVNYSFSLSEVSSISGLTAFFDQYCIYAISITVQCNDVGVSATTETGRAYTAIDYDNINALGSEAAIQAFGTCVQFVPGRGSVQRFFKPCVAPAVYNTGGTFTGYGVSRSWLDCASAAIPHYGYRSFYAANSVSGLNIDHAITYVVGFRNNN